MHWPSLLQLAASILAALLLLGAAAVFVFTGIAQLLNPGRGVADLTQPFMIAGSLAFAGILILPSAWYSWKRLSYPGREPVSRPEPRNYGLILTVVVLIVESVTLIVGNLVSQNSQVAWLLLPPLNIIATGLPTLWLIYIGTRGLLPAYPRYKWGVFASGLVLGPLIILILELILLVGIGILAILWIMVNPSLAPQLNNLILNLEHAGSDTNAILDALTPFIFNPGIIFLGFATVSVLIPIIEETFKPIGVWFTAGTAIIPAQGFAFGILSGAGFGLFENLGNTSSGGEAWALLAASRISTLLLHSFTAGLVGWGLASAWCSRRYIRLGACFLAAVFIHGLWNGLAVLSSVSSLQGIVKIPLPSNLEAISTLATAGIFALGLTVLVLFITLNAIFRRQIPPVIPENPVSAPPGGAQTGGWLASPSGEALPSIPDPTSPSYDTPGGNPHRPENNPQQPADDYPIKTPEDT